MRSIVLLLLIFSINAHSESIKVIHDIVKLAGPYLITDEQAQNSLIHLYVPKSSVGVVGFSGGDKVSTAQENHLHLSLNVTKDKNTIFITNNMKVGTVTNFGVNNLCGKSISIAVHSIGLNSKADEIQPKLSIKSKSCT